MQTEICRGLKISALWLGVLSFALTQACLPAVATRQPIPPIPIAIPENTIGEQCIEDQARSEGRIGYSMSGHTKQRFAGVGWKIVGEGAHWILEEGAALPEGQTYGGYQIYQVGPHTKFYIFGTNGTGSMIDVDHNTPDLISQTAQYVFFGDCGSQAPNDGTLP